MKEITEYLLKNASIKTNIISGDRLKDDSKLCMKYIIEDAFKLGKNGIDCKYYDAVVQGEGKEKDKINSLYSSSLQSLLVFCGVSADNPITVDGIEYTKVMFEYKNKVIGYPSSVDVVLMSKDEKKVLFIESKLYEIVRDSDKEGKCEVGPSYLSTDENGYKKLGLCQDDLTEIGIDLKDTGIFGTKNPSDMKKHILGSSNQPTRDGNGWVRIKPIKGNEYVYSYGIKQYLSHIIGIMNYKTPDTNCSTGLKDRLFSKIGFLILYNDLPGYTKEDAKEKIKSFKKHCETVKGVLEKKAIHVDGIPIDISMESYQKLAEEAKPYFDKMPATVKEYYHLNERET
ncbi:MAG: hypothetical protein MJ070_00890 [Lachnospiraceae bacterium]|nr:hypothetical protein [Lachnospiraceae bacterium]